jgi:hypothetical protein
MWELRVKKANGGSRNGSPTRSARLPIRWDDVPHQELQLRISNAMATGSRARAFEDSLEHVLRRRLPKLDPADHFKYAELLCVDIVETLRVVRDVYRAYLEERGCRPIAEMYWVVFRFAVTSYAVKMLRTRASRYVRDSQVDATHWETLYGYRFAVRVPLGRVSNIHKPVERTLEDSVKNVIPGLVDEQGLQQVVTGGPFGRDGQIVLGRDRPTVEFQMGTMNLMESIKHRQELWEQCYPWTEVLARLFDACQEELLFQHAALPQDARQAESRFLALSDFERIAYGHLLDLGRMNTNARNLGDDGWMALLRDLDEHEVPLDCALSGKAKHVLDAVRKKGNPIATCVGDRPIAPDPR